jgi:hypothetical protein
MELNSLWCTPRHENILVFGLFQLETRQRFLPISRPTLAAGIRCGPSSDTIQRDGSFGSTDDGTSSLTRSVRVTMNALSVKQMIMFREEDQRFLHLSV